MRKLIIIFTILLISNIFYSQEIDFFHPESIMPGYEATYRKTIIEDEEIMFQGLIAIHRLQVSREKSSSEISLHITYSSDMKADEFIIDYDKSRKKVLRVQKYIDGRFQEMEKEEGMPAPFISPESKEQEKVSLQRDRKQSDLEVLQKNIPVQVNINRYKLENEVKDPNNPYLVLNVSSMVEERTFISNQEDMPSLLKHIKDTMVSRRFINLRDPERKYPHNKEIPMRTEIELIEYKASL